MQYKQLSEMFKQGYKSGYLTAVHNIKKTGNQELVEELLKAYNQYPTIEPITEAELKKC